MNRTTAIVGGGISGLAAAYELTRRGERFTLFEASGRLGGTVESVCTQGFVIECGPDSWVSEKPWARELAIELGLEAKLLPSNDESRATYLVKTSKLAALPDGMRMMVPVKWAPLLRSPLLSWQARLAYLREPGRASELRAAAPKQDEPVADFVRRHFGEEVTRTLAGPLLAGVFGGDIRTLSVRAVLPGFVKMEAEHGSLISALRDRPPAGPGQAIFSTLADGLQELIDRIVQRLAEDSVHLRERVLSIRYADVPATGSGGKSWRVTTSGGEQPFDSLVLATPAHVTSELLRPLEESGERMADLLPASTSSAIVVAMAFDHGQASQLQVPRGFGFLVPPAIFEAESLPRTEERALLACTFMDQKFAHRAPRGARLLRAFFGGPAAEGLLGKTDEALVVLARRQLARILGSSIDSRESQGTLDGSAEGLLPEPTLTVVRRWPRSLPQYAVGHLDRIAELEELAGRWPGLRLIGNAYHGVGLPDLIRAGRAAARSLREVG